MNRESLIQKPTVVLLALVALMMLAVGPVAARSYFLTQGRAAARYHDYQHAIEDFSQAIAQDPSDKAAYEARGLCYLNDKVKKYDLARADFESIIRLDPHNGRAFALRGVAYYREQQYQKASDDFVQAIALNPQDPQAYNSAAWLLATCPDAKIRNGPKAVEFATKACELSSWRSPALNDTLAAAYAENGQFGDAVKMENQAIEIWSRWKNAEASIKSAQGRLDFYQARKPYREAGK